MELSKYAYKTEYKTYADNIVIRTLETMYNCITYSFFKRSTNIISGEEYY